MSIRKLETVITALENAGIPAYYPGQHEGICTSPYCVVQSMGSFPEAGRGPGYEIIRIHLYVPVGRFSLLETLIEQVESALSGPVGQGQLRPYEEVGACLIEEAFRAHTCYLDCRVQYGLGS